MTSGTPDARSAQIQEFLVAGQDAAEAGSWVAAGSAWIEAAKLGSLDGANAVSRVAAPHIRSLADTGDIDAQALIAGILMDYYAADALPTAIGYAKAAAKAGHPAGLRTYGFMVQNGMGQKANEARAIELYQAAAEKGDGYAAFNLGVLARSAQVKFTTHDECIRLLTQAADSGIVPAGARLADELAAVDRDEEALTWLVWAAERGHDGAMNAAGSWYRDCIGTPVDNVQALRWLLPLTAKPNMDAVHAIHQLGELMTDEQIREAGRLSGHPVEAETTVATLTRNRDRKGS
ncbi:sel1 repeat family protein [Actinospica durhamensis]|uniref:Sel1 repeat family protein n=1 Tax=Actinospica durhamensis TaxID=1508375 RepID=A0A941EPJ8_9ACTN|nr:tetratricopeptide repeat protein [Actinospica durhamensis]MBR7834183.1 sel1 repeat family protein [Actinospica durhamensis]